MVVNVELLSTTDEGINIQVVQSRFTYEDKLY